MNILNLTRHATTLEQRAQGVLEPSPQDKADIKRLLTFEGCPSEEFLRRRAMILAVIADSYDGGYVLIEDNSALTAELLREIPGAITKI